MSRFATQLPDTITLLANSLRAGSSFLQGLELVTREGRPPISEEFERVVREMSLGVALQPALNNLVRRVKSEDLELMVTAINIQSQVGGNLATVLDSIAFTIRERIRIIGEINTLTAMQRYSGYVITLLPVGLGGILFLISPSVHRPDAAQPAGDPGPAGGRRLPDPRLHQHGHRLCADPPHRRHQGVILMAIELIIAGLAAAAILLLTIGLTVPPAEGRRPGAPGAARRSAQDAGGVRAAAAVLRARDAAHGQAPVARRRAAATRAA